MKKIILTIFILLSTPIVFSQTGLEENNVSKKETNYLYSPLNHMRTYVFAGGTYYNISGDLDAEAKPGFSIGVNAEAGQGLTYLVGVKYQMTSHEFEVNNLKSDFSLNYLNLILGAKYYFSGANSGFFLRGNLDPSLLVSSSGEDNSLDFKDFNVFAQIGAGFTFPGATQFILDLAFNQGLMDISKNNNDDSKAQGISLNFGLLF